MENSLAQLIPAILAGLLGSACGWFTLARTLVTRKEVQEMIQARVDALADANERQERAIDAMRAELVGLRGDVIRLGVLLGIERARDREPTTGGN